MAAPKPPAPARPVLTQGQQSRMQNALTVCSEWLGGSGGVPLIILIPFGFPPKSVHRRVCLILLRVSLELFAFAHFIIRNVYSVLHF